MDNLVSIIMPAFNAQAFIASAVKSVLSQTHRDWELLLVSDDHTDYQKALASHGINDSRFIFLKSDTVASGPNAARNVALERAKGQWLAPLDADDVYYPTRLEKLLLAAKETGLALDNVLVCSGNGYQTQRLVYQNNFSHLTFYEFQQSLAPLLFLFRRDLVEQGWDTDVIRGADTLFNLRALEAAGSAGFVCDPLHEYRIHDASMCHAPGSENLFVSAYQHTLKRLKSDGLFFKTDAFRENVIAMLEEKVALNLSFSEAVKTGYTGNYQAFVASEQARRA